MLRDIVVVGENTPNEVKEIAKAEGFEIENRVLIHNDDSQISIKKTIISLLNSSVQKMRVLFLESSPLMIGLLAYYNGFIDSERGDNKTKILSQKDISIFVLDGDRNIVEIK